MLGDKNEKSAKAWRTRRHTLCTPYVVVRWWQEKISCQVLRTWRSLQYIHRRRLHVTPHFYNRAKQLNKFKIHCKINKPNNPNILIYNKICNSIITTPAKSKINININPQILIKSVRKKATKTGWYSWHSLLPLITYEKETNESEPMPSK